MHVRRITAFLATSCLLSACASAPNGKTIAGGAIAISGVALTAHGSTEADCGDRSPGSCAGHQLGWFIDDGGAGAVLLGVGLVALGVGLALSGLRDAEQEHDAEVAAESQIDYSPPVNPFANAAPPEPAAAEGDLPANAVIVDRIENRLAIQASLIARAGNCASAITTGNELAKRDAAMFAKLLAADADLKTCYDEIPPSP